MCRYTWQFIVGAAIVLLAAAIFGLLIGTALRVPGSSCRKAGCRSRPSRGARPGDLDDHRRPERGEGRRPARRRASLSRMSDVEIAPTGVPGLLDQLGKAMEDLKKRFLGQ
jgi:hypothetical protein